MSAFVLLASDPIERLGELPIESLFLLLPFLSVVLGLLLDNRLLRREIRRLVQIRSAHQVSIEAAELAGATVKSSWSALLTDHEYFPGTGNEWLEGERCHADRPGCVQCAEIQSRGPQCAEAVDAAIAALRDGHTRLAVQHAARLNHPEWTDDAEHDAFLRAVLDAGFAPELANSVWQRVAAHPNALHPCDVEDLVRLALGKTTRHPWPLEDLDEECTDNFSALPIYDHVGWEEPMYLELLDWHAAIEGAAVALLRRGEYRAAHALLDAASSAHPSCPSVRGFANTMFWADRIDDLGLTAKRFGPGLADFAPRLDRFHVELEAIVRKGLRPPSLAASPSPTPELS